MICLVDLHSTENEEKSGVIERFNRTIKENMFKYLSANNTRKCVDVLDLLVDQYNSTIQSSIKMTPKEASHKENENKVLRNLYTEFFGGKTLTPKFSIADHVRITKKKKTFDNSYTQRWTEEVCTITKIKLAIPVTYKITDYNREEVQGSLSNRSWKRRRRTHSESKNY